MKSILSLFSGRKDAIIEELKAQLEKANLKIDKYEAANASLGKTIKAVEEQRRELTEELQRVAANRDRMFEKIKQMRIELAEIRHHEKRLMKVRESLLREYNELEAKYLELEARSAKRGSNGRFIKRDKKTDK